MKILVLGLDCAAPELLLGYEDLPNIRRLMEVGCYGRLESVIPPITVPAWMCLATSQDPGSLGVYGFRNRTDHSYSGLGIAIVAVDHRAGHLGPPRPRGEAVDHRRRAARLPPAQDQRAGRELLPHARYRQERLHPSARALRRDPQAGGPLPGRRRRASAPTTRPGSATRSSP